jgi:predicted nucleic acid-binding protein
MALVAVLDANVLWPQYLRDVLIRAAGFDLYRAVWTERILDEVRRSVVRRGRVPPEQIERTLQFMRERCAQFMVDGYEDLIPVMTNHDKDRHVLAAAVYAGADTIVTNNLKDFPPQSREQYGIELHTPDDFLLELWITSPGDMARMLVNWAAGLTRPPYSARDLVEEQLSKQAPHFASVVLATDELEAAQESERDGVPLPAYRLL